MYLPEVPWYPPDPAIRSCPTDGRTPSRYLAVVRQFDVEKHPRYQRRDGNHDGVIDTYCNVFVTDIAEAYGVYLPHWHLNMEFSANRLIDWLENSKVAFPGTSIPLGSNYGWEKVSKHVAKAAVMEGIFTIATYRNPTGGSGHVAVVLPINYDGDTNPYIAQAGRTNFVGRRLTDGFGELPVRFFTCR